MGAQFGKCSFDGKPVDTWELDRVRPILAPYGPDGEGVFKEDNVAILSRALYVTKESRNEAQPCVSASGSVITWDGRLDNREELVGAFRGEVSNSSSDLSIVATAYERWATNCFARLLGDWALSIWDPRSRSLTLAKDFIGTRPLFYVVDQDCAAWCTILDPLVLFAGHSLALEEEYLAGWLTRFPAPHLTPYVGIHSVPPSSYVHLTKGRQKVNKYWDFDPARSIRYGSDAGYEEHFRAAFSESVRRRLRSDKPVLAELSGGMDSSSIVCLADKILARGGAETSRLDTISYFDDSEPNWNERPYFTKVEDLRGRPGCHIDVGSRDQFVAVDKNLFAVAPSSCDRGNKTDKQRATFIYSNGNRVLLSGIGGDEVTGGVPTPIPELADLLADARFGALAHQLRVWALNKRKPWIHLFFEVVCRFLPPALGGGSKHVASPQWLRASFARRYRPALGGYEKRLRLLGPQPSLQENVSTLDALRRQLTCDFLPLEPPYEKRYPFLDRDLLEFLFAIPREQLLRPGQRRSLMRRALKGTVPEEILNRKRKAYLARSPIAALLARAAYVAEPGERMLADSLGIFDSDAFAQALRNAREGREVPVVTLLRSLGIEVWLRLILPRGVRPSASVSGSCLDKAMEQFLS